MRPTKADMELFLDQPVNLLVKTWVHCQTIKRRYIQESSFSSAKVSYLLESMATSLSNSKNQPSFCNSLPFGNTFAETISLEAVEIVREMQDQKLITRDVFKAFTQNKTIAQELLNYY